MSLISLCHMNRPMAFSLRCHVTVIRLRNINKAVKIKSQHQRKKDQSDGYVTIIRKMPYIIVEGDLEINPKSTNQQFITSVSGLKGV